jgi:tetratricopeptide (TPR) repeat protein
MNTESHSALRLYNPDWLSDDELVAGFTARQEMLKFLCGELERAPVHGTTQHYLLIGVRGSGKTSLLKRIAVAIRRETCLSDHLIGLSFPEELYEVKGLSDFWWASCRALVDALDNGPFGKVVDQLAERVEEQEKRGPARDPHDDAGLRLMLDVCAQIRRRPVLLVDNLDLVLKRIDKSGRKLKDRQSPAYWALREVLSTATAPIMVGGSVRLSAPFLGHDDAFYDYFVAQRLGKLSLEEVRNVFDQLACNHGGEPLRERIRNRPGRMRALYEMTGGNPRALGLVFELLRRGPNSSAVDAFEQLLDLTTPYYKARFEELPEQAQVVLHALALSRRHITKANFGHKAAVVAQKAGLDTRVVSAQLEMLINEGVVEKNRSLGERAQYRVAEQLFRLWLQMRSTRRLRQQVISLTEFLEALFDRDEYEELIRRENNEPPSSSFRSRAKLSLALSELQRENNRRYALETRAADAMLAAGEIDSSQIEGIFAPGDLSDGIEFEARRNLQKCASWHKTLRSDSGQLTRDLLGSLRIKREDKRTAIEKLCDRQQAEREFARIAPLLEEERRELRESLSDAEIDLLYSERASGRLTLPHVLPEDMELAAESTRSLVWKLFCEGMIRPDSSSVADAWVTWGKNHFAGAAPSDWTDIARAMRRQNYLPVARKALDFALADGKHADAWCELALLDENQENWSAAELAYRKALDINPADALVWSYLGGPLNRQKRYEEAELALRKAINLDETNGFCWAMLGLFLSTQLRHDEAESALRKATQVESAEESAWSDLGDLFVNRQRLEEAEAAYRKAIDLAPYKGDSWCKLGRLLKACSRFEEAESAFRSAIDREPSLYYGWMELGSLYEDRSRFEEAEAAYRKGLQIRPANASGWCRLGAFLKARSRYDEADAAYRKAIDCDSKQGYMGWIGLGNLFEIRSQFNEAESAFRRAIAASPNSHYSWAFLGSLLECLHRDDEAEQVLRKAVELPPAGSEAWNRLGSLLGRQGRVEEAAAAYRKSIEIDPSFAPAHVALGRLLSNRMGRFDEAAEVFSEALELTPDDQQLRAELGATQSLRMLTEVIHACLSSNWEQLSKELSTLASSSRDVSWLTSAVFIERVVRHSLRRGDGAKLLATLQEARLDTSAAPLLLALDAAIEGNAEKLATVEPEARSAAQLIFKWLTQENSGQPSN